MATDKLDSLLDTIDTELSDLEDFIEAQEPTIEDTESREDGGSEEFEEEALLIEDADGKAESAETAAGLESEPRSLDDATDSTIDVLSDAENEVEIMLSGEEAREDGGASAVPVTEEEAEAQDSDTVLAELLSTREVDASEVFKKEDAPEEPETKARNTQLFEDLFSEMETTIESNEDGTDADEPPALELDLTEDLLNDQETAPASVEDVSDDSESSTPGEDLPDDLFADLKLEQQAEESREVDLVAESSLEAGSSDELAALISKKMEALVTRLVEEQLPELADRIISEKLKKIISSME